jgi:hypothetical protein
MPRVEKDAHTRKPTQTYYNTGGSPLCVRSNAPTQRYKVTTEEQYRYSYYFFKLGAR